MNAPTYPTLDDWERTRGRLAGSPWQRCVSAWNHGNAAGHAAGRDAAITQALLLVRARLAVNNCTGHDILRILETQLPKVCP